MHYRVYLFEGDIAYNDVYKARHACNILTTFVAANTARVTRLALTGSSHKIFASLAIYLFPLYCVMLIRRRFPSSKVSLLPRYSSK